MKSRIEQLVAASPFVLCSLLGATTALGQITPDNTLGNERSVVTPNVNINGALADLIEGGAIRDSNLFHSFQDFNVAEFGRVYFANPAGIQNILSRVTGTNVSNILGTLGVLGNANLFLINPNGIFFGPNSRLDLGGSFFGSTADSVLFEDGTVFSTKNPNDKPLLTINIPSGLQYGSNPGSITNQSSGLEVPNGQTLGLIGGEVTIPNGALGASDGRIELGSVGSNGVVNLTPTDTSFVLDYSPVQEFQDISLSEGAGVNTSGEGGGSIKLQGSNVSLGDRSGVFANTNGSGSGAGIVVKASKLSLEGGSRITGNVLGSGQGGDVTVDTSESVRVSGVSADGTMSALGTRVLAGATGNAGDVSITTGELIVKDGAVVSAGTVGEGNGGTLSVDASSSIKVMGRTPDGQLPGGLFSQTNPGSTGNAGKISITTGELIVSDGAVVSASTFGKGKGGSLIVNASSRIELIGGTIANTRFPNGLFSATTGTGNGGNVSITTGELIVSDGAVVSATTRREGNGGTLSVNASRIELMGISADGRFSSGLFASTEGKGNGGDVSINTGELIVSDGALVRARSIQQGSLAGTVDINANSIFLNNNGRISAETAAGENSNIDNSNIMLEARDIRLLNESLILTDARNTTTGGNITIDTDTLVGLGNSDITANAEEGPGGSVEIKAQGIFGLEFRDSLTPENDITATSELGSSFSGEVILNTPDVDPTSGLTELPGSPVDAEAILANDLCGFENNRIAGGSSFFITGKGGLPASADDPVINTDRTVGWLSRPGLASNRQRLQQQANVTRPQPPQEKKVIIEAQGWVIAKDGTIILTAQPFRGTPVDQILPHLDCHVGIGNREQGTGI
ncbi:filamentous hemagglutinin N-terminal domain-containing protein [Moorena sp. SIO3H5]|uniref:two-partner secretion domain-containing protein n=1 Tax=Moorena sp. SIO3H5 TaxID=2607834 RepID=UPI0013BBDB81|nr:filamentous hemagglutinin N-terminal domain-containing protein [Moorena sp. SIO3H5]NEO70615.1 filamentous hemagglutinin N-terminal domain-containing protein [Moorena sp. SIO3H5]